MDDREVGWWRAVRHGSPGLPSMALDAVDARFAVALRQCELADVFEREAALARRSERRGECLARIDHSGRRHRLDACGARDARAKMAVAPHDGIEGVKY